MRVQCGLCLRVLSSMREAHYHLMRIHHMSGTESLEASSVWLQPQAETSGPASTNSSPTIEEQWRARSQRNTPTGPPRTSNSSAEPSLRSTRRTMLARAYGSSRSNGPSMLPSPGLDMSSRSELTQLLDSTMGPLGPSTPKPNDTAVGQTLVRLGLAVRKLPCTSGHASNCIHRRQFQGWLSMLSREGRLNFLPRFDEWMTLSNRLNSRPTPCEMLSKWQRRLLAIAEVAGGPRTAIHV
jgi:hypothetical protein